MMGCLMEFEFGLKELDTVVKDNILPLLKKYSIFTFTGPLGAGKTTLIRSIFRQSGIADVISSPTFGYVNTYVASDGTVYNHFDLYRINSIEEFVKLGFEEYLSKSGCINFVEWPEVIQALLVNTDLKTSVCDIALGYVHNDLSRRALKIGA
jgi:tRNA threonylcarbamoyladenosine biosynthesis protein TsaE